MKRLMWWAVFLLCLGGITVASAQHFPRFHRYALTRLDDTTTLDVVKDAKTGACRLVYRTQTTLLHSYGTSAAMSTTYLGEVPCDPIPVPPPASPIK